MVVVVVVVIVVVVVEIVIVLVIIIIILIVVEALAAIVVVVVDPRHMLIQQVLCKHGCHTPAVLASVLPAWWPYSCCFSSASMVAEHLLFQQVFRQAVAEHQLFQLVFSQPGG